MDEPIKISFSERDMTYEPKKREPRFREKISHYIFSQFLCHFEANDFCYKSCQKTVPIQGQFDFFFNFFF